MLKEFRDFVARGNVFDMAVGIIVGAAFGPIARSLVDDVIMPPIGLLLGKVDFANLFIVLRPAGARFPSLAAARDAGAVTMNLGLFINTLITFLVVAFVVFLLVRQVNRLKKPAPVAAPTTKECQFCLSAVPLKATRCPHCTSQLGA